MTWPPCTSCGQTPTRATRRGMCHRCYMNWWSRRRGYGTFESLYVDAKPVREHINALRAAGLSKRRIAELSGVGREALRRLTIGRPDRATGPSRQVLAKLAEKLYAVAIPDTLHHATRSCERVPAVGTVRRCQSLVAWGYSRTDIGRRIGWTVQNMGRLMDPATTQVNADTARKVESVFRELQSFPGSCTRARNEGKRRGWPLPFTWDEDDIDNPEQMVHQPIHDEPISFAEQYGEFRDIGLSDREIAVRLGIKLSSLERRLDRHDIPVRPILRQLAREERVAS